MAKKKLQPIFSYNSNVEKNAYLNWRTDSLNRIHNLWVMAEGYRDAAIYLTRIVLDDNYDKKADVIIFPILFDANHAIELYLKEILWCQYILLEKGQKIEGAHDIRYLYNAISNRMDDVLKKYNFLFEKKQDFNHIMMNLKTYIDELYEKLMMTDEKGNPISNIDFSRYPFSKDYQDHFYVKEIANVVVDLENFSDRFREIGDNLSMLANYFNELVEMKAEAYYMDQEYYE